MGMEEVQTGDKKRDDSIFLRQLSTEMRSALSGIVAVADELKTSLSGADELIDKLNKIEENSDALYNIANSIVDYTDLSQKNLKLENVTFSIKTVMSNLVTEMNLFANRKNVHLFTNVRDVEDIQIHADKSRFEQVIKRYVEYAVDHSPTEGNVFIVLRYKYLSHNTIKVIVEMETAGMQMYHAIASDYEFLHQKKYKKIDMAEKALVYISVIICWKRWEERLNIVLKMNLKAE